MNWKKRNKSLSTVSNLQTCWSWEREISSQTKFGRAALCSFNAARPAKSRLYHQSNNYSCFDSKCCCNRQWLRSQSPLLQQHMGYSLTMFYMLRGKMFAVYQKKRKQSLALHTIRYSLTRRLSLLRILIIVPDPDPSYDLYRKLSSTSFKTL